MPRSDPAFLLAALVLAAAPSASLRAEAPACKAETAGVVACFAGRMCACGRARGGRMTGAGDGYRWDCGILRPACGGGPDTPAMTGDYPDRLPSSLSLERDTLVIRPRPDRHHRDLRPPRR